MSTTSDELFELTNRLEETSAKSRATDVQEPLNALENAADRIGKAWSGSWIGYHSRVYYHGLEAPPPGAQFSPEWGLQQVFGDATRGQWEVYDFDSVQNAVYEAAGNPDLSEATSLAEKAHQVFEDSQAEIASILSVMLEEKEDTVISGLKAEADNLELYSGADFIETIRPKEYWSRDSSAMSQGVRVPPHTGVFADVVATRWPVEQCEELAKIAKRAASHSARRARHLRGESEVSGMKQKKVFIGHGRSPVWRDLKDFVYERLNLSYDEFNRTTAAGLANTERLSQMLDDAAIAFLVMTAEDEQKDGTLNARLNVVHEAGLFQGRIGFKKAIVLLEEGCEEFSNIHGHGQIRFPKDNISAKTEEIREVLQREGVISS